MGRPVDDRPLCAQPKDSVKLREVLEKETKIELDRKRKASVRETDLIGPSKKVWALATLYSSLVRLAFPAFVSFSKV